MEKWYFRREDLAKTPTISQKLISEKEERGERSRGCLFIVQVGMELQLPQITIATACVYFHRFYMRMTFKDYPKRNIAATALYLSTKVEETGRQLTAIIGAIAQVAERNPGLLVDRASKEYWEWKDRITQMEEVLLETICFDIEVEHPYRYLLALGDKHNLNQEVLQASWAFINDSLRTPICVIYKPERVAQAALYFAFTQPRFSNLQSLLTTIGEDISHEAMEEIADIFTEVTNLYSSSYMARNKHHIRANKSAPPTKQTER